MRRDSRINEFRKLPTAKFGWLERLQFRRQFPFRDFGAFCVEMDLRSTEIAASRLRLSFEDVPEFHMRELHGVPFLFYVNEIEAIGDRQLEGLKYRVHESENAASSFLRRSFEATVEPISD